MEREAARGGNRVSFFCSFFSPNIRFTNLHTLPGSQQSWVRVQQIAPARPSPHTDQCGSVANKNGYIFRLLIPHIGIVSKQKGNRRASYTHTRVYVRSFRFLWVFSGNRVRAGHRSLDGKRERCSGLCYSNQESRRFIYIILLLSSHPSAMRPCLL